MTDRLPSDDIDDDVAWVRQHLGAANPVPRVDGAPTPPVLSGAALASAAATHGAITLEGRRADGRRRATLVTAAVGAAALIGAVVAVGVNGGGGSRPTRITSPQPLLTAAAATAAARSAEVSLSLTVGTTVTNVQGAADLSTGNADVTADLPAGLGTAEVLSVGQVAYVRLPPGMQSIFGGKPWVKADLSTVEGLAGAQVGVPGLGSGFQFSGILDWLGGVSGSVSTVGSETIHGDATTHYRAEVDLTKAAASAPAARQAELQQAAIAAGQTIPVDIWLDGQGRLRQMTVSFDPAKAHLPSGAALHSPGVVVATVDLWNFGAAVNVTPPPADQVAPMTGIPGVVKGILGTAGIGGLGGAMTATTPPGH